MRVIRIATTFCCISLALSPGVAAQDPPISAEREAARAKLGQLGVDYSRDALVKHAGEGDTIAVKLFIAAGMPVDARSRENRTPLMAAIAAGCTETAQALLARGANVNATTFGDLTILMTAATAGNADLVRLLIGKGAGINHKSGQGYTALWWGVDHPEVVKALLDHGADVDTVASDGSTPLIRAAEQGSGATIRLLLSRGADPNLKTKAAHPETELAGYPETALTAAIRRNRPEAVTALLEGGADANSRAAAGGIPLVLAAGSNNLEIVRALLARGAEVNVQSYEGYTPLILAAEHGNIEAVKLLIEKGADVNAKAGPRELTALRAASNRRQSQVVQLLVKAGAKE